MKKLGNKQIPIWVNISLEEEREINIARRLQDKTMEEYVRKALINQAKKDNRPHRRIWNVFKLWIFEGKAL